MNKKLFWVIILAALIVGLGGLGLYKYRTAKAQQRAQELIAVLGEDDAEVRIQAIYALSDMGSAADAAVPALLGALRDLHPGVREAAVVALYRIGRFGEPEDNLVTALIAHLDDEAPEARFNTAVVLGGLGQAAEPAIPALTAVLRDEDPQVRAAAREALHRIEKTGASDSSRQLPSDETGTAAEEK